MNVFYQNGRSLKYVRHENNRSLCVPGHVNSQNLQLHWFVYSWLIRVGPGSLVDVLHQIRWLISQQANLSRNKSPTSPQRSADIYFPGKELRAASCCVDAVDGWHGGFIWYQLSVHTVHGAIEVIKAFELHSIEIWCFILIFWPTGISSSKFIYGCLIHHSIFLDRIQQFFYSSSWFWPVGCCDSSWDVFLSWGVLWRMWVI